MTTIPKRFLGAFKIGHRVPNRPYIDEELSFQLLNKILASNYTDLESIQQLDYITQFNNEYYQARAPKNSNPLHISKEHIKANGDANNARRRDIMTREYNFLSSIEYPFSLVEEDEPEP